MTYISINYYVLVAIIVIVYYLLPIKYRWTALLCGSAVFYVLFYKKGWWLILGTIIASFYIALVIEKRQGTEKKNTLIIGIIMVTIPWILSRNITELSWGLVKNDPFEIIAPLGISFYTLQIIAYMVDVYYGKIAAQKNLFKYMLFVSFFPQILQGPIPRYNQLQEQLVQGHNFDEKKFTKGICYIIWGFFLKLVIADKAGVFVGNVYSNYPAFAGAYLWVASILYSVQLYTDFLACTTLAQGVSMLFGIELIDNFNHPYFATSVKEFWRRWHISLSTWLKDYIYIPLGGNRNGHFSKQRNLIITFIVSGIWHGAGAQFIFWGLLHAFYQVIGEITNPIREEIYAKLNVSKDSKDKIVFKTIGTFLLVNWAWVIFRADSLIEGFGILKNMFAVFNPWILFNDRIYTLGLDIKDFIVLILGILSLAYAGSKHQQGRSVSEAIIRRKLPVRWFIMILGITIVMVFGTYGYGYSASDFIYGGF